MGEGSQSVLAGNLPSVQYSVAMGRPSISPAVHLLLLLAGPGRGEGPTWGAEEDDEYMAAEVKVTRPAASSGGYGACLPCDPGSCESPFGCQAGVVRDRCGCCQVRE